MNGAGTLARPHPAVTLLLAVVAVLFAVGMGLVIGDPGSRPLIVPLGGVVGLVLLGYILTRPFAGFLVLVFSSFMLIVLQVTAAKKYINFFDFSMLPVIAVTLLGRARDEARAMDARERGPGHDEVRRASDRLGGAASVYFGLAVLSVLVMPFRLGVMPAVQSGFSLVRGLQGAMLFPLALWWLRGERRIDATLRVAFAAVAVMAIVNTVGGALHVIPRAGMVWMVNDPRQPVDSPNEAAAGLLLVWVILQARQTIRPGRFHLVLMAVVLGLLPLTQSRSGVLAFATYLLLTLRHVRWRWLFAGLLFLALMVPIIPAAYWARMTRSFSLRPGSFEFFTLLLRFHCYQTAWRVFLDHPLFGVGYLGFRFVSMRYSELHLILGQVENGFLETLVGLGLLGLTALLVVLQRLYALGRTVRRATRPGTLAHELARRNGPLLAALLVANLTGTTLVGMAMIGQLAVWAALLARSGHLAIGREGAA